MSETVRSGNAVGYMCNKQGSILILAYTCIHGLELRKETSLQGSLRISGVRELAFTAVPNQDGHPIGRVWVTD